MIIKALFFRKIFTTLAIMIPIRPMNINCPNPVRSRLVVQPYMLNAINVPEHIKNVDAMDDMVYAAKINDNVAPFKIAYNRNMKVAVPDCNF